MHPVPALGEALSSWLSRIAEQYRVTVDDLTFDLGYGVDGDTDLDMAPPEGFAEQVAIRTGVSVNQLRKMSLSGFVPWLFDDIVPGRDGFTTYARQFSVLLAEGKRTKRRAGLWRAWVPAMGKSQQRACPQCVAASAPPHPYQLMWSVPLMLSCLAHDCLLEPHDGLRGYYYSWHQEPPTPRQTNAAIRAMDARTWQALTTGRVDLPRRRVHAGIWFRLLRTLIDELSATLKESGQRLTRQVWEHAGHPFRAGQLVWYPYEELPLEVQLPTLEATATAIQLLESAVLSGQGRQVELFLPEPDVSVDPGKPPPRATANSVTDKPKSLVEAMHAAVEHAKQDPESARQLFNFMTLYRGENPEHIQRVRTNFEELGIPLDFLSQ